MKHTLSWNLHTQIQKHPETWGWFIGSFMEKFPEFLSQKIEIKWISRKKWEIKPGLSSPKHIKTLTILFSGKVRIDFPDTQESILLEKTWDFAFFDTSVSDHTTYILEDCIMIAVRWEEE